VSALPRTPELHALGAGQVDQLAGMVLELATQLHVERARLRALEHHLVERGVLAAGEVGAEIPAALRESLQQELNRSLGGLFASAAERDDARAPLRDEQDRS
jgi:hypothetical protein